MLLDNFPSGYVPRPGQVEILERLDRWMSSKKKFALVVAPTGSGKSLISATLAASTPEASKEYLRDLEQIAKAKGKGSLGTPTAACKFGTFVLTTTKALQEQYANLFEDAFVLKGRANYSCSVESTCNCENAPCIVSPSISDECRELDFCPYHRNRSLVMASRFGVLSYTMFLCLPEWARRRCTIVCDECSAMEGEIAKEFSLEIEYFPLFKEIGKHKILTSESRDVVMAWLSDINEILQGRIEAVGQSLAGTSKKAIGEIAAKVKTLNYLRGIMESMRIVLENWGHCEYVVEFDSKRVKISPIQVDRLTGHIFDYADKVVLMSATIIDSTKFCESLGIEDYEYMEIDSTFDPAKSPIYCPGTLSMAYADIDKNLPKVVDMALAICRKYEGKSGIIHTHSFKITEAIKRAVGDDPRFLFREDGASNEKILREHRDRPVGSVLVSPSMSFGVDLADDMARFQILMKLPYPPLGDKRIKRIFDIDKQRYANEMLVTLVQACSRATRSETDFSDTFILDGGAVAAIRRNWTRIPKWFRDRLK